MTDTAKLIALGKDPPLAGVRTLCVALATALEAAEARLREALEQCGTFYGPRSRVGSVVRHALTKDGR